MPGRKIRAQKKTRQELYEPRSSHPFPFSHYSLSTLKNLTCSARVFCSHIGQTSQQSGLRGGPRRTRTSNQTVMSLQLVGRSAERPVLLHLRYKIISRPNKNYEPPDRQCHRLPCVSWSGASRTYIRTDRSAAFPTRSEVHCLSPFMDLAALRVFILGSDHSS
jgi:hypothetical protein